MVNVHIGENSYVNIGTTISDNVIISCESMVCASAVVIRAKKMKICGDNVLNKIIKIEGVRLLFLLLLSILVCAFTWCHYGVQFSGMDDYSLMAFMSGVYTGQIEAFLYFPNIVYTLLVSLLYRMTTQLPWFTVVFLVGVFLSVFALAKSTLKSANSMLGLTCTTAVFLVVYCGVFMYASSLLQFTSVSSMCGAGAIVLIATLDDTDACWERILDLILIIVLAFMGISIRKDTGYFVIAVLIATCVYKFIEGRLNKKIVAQLLINLIILFVVLISVQKIYLLQTDWAEYKRYNDARIGILDHACIIYENDPQFFDSIGWDEELVNLAEGNWYAMDDAIEVSDMEAIRVKSDDYFAQTKKSGLSQIIKVTDIGFTYRYLGFWGIVLLAVIAGSLISKRRSVDLIGAVAYYFGAVALVVFLGLFGRMTFAVMNTVFMLAMPTSLIFISKFLSDNECKLWIKGVAILFVLVLSYKMLLTGRGLCQRINHYEDEIARKYEVDEYIAKNSNSLFIYDTNLPLMGTAFDTPSGRGKYNLIFWGGTFYNSPLYHRQLALCGYDSFSSEYWFNNDVYYMTKDEPNLAFVEYMKKHYPGCEIVLVEKHEGFNVYRLKLA